VSSSHRTSAIARPRSTARAHPSVPRRKQSVDSGDHTLIGDLTRPIAPDRQLVTRRTNRWVLALLTLAVLGALAGAMFVLPVQAWMQQRDEMVVKQDQLAVLEGANAELTNEVEHLQTTEGAKEAARDELGMVGPGEQRVSLLPPDMASITLPGGWPYDAISQVVAVRAAPVEPAAASAP
jgi:cell division protein FtsB